MTGPRIVIVGAGIIGASIAWHAARVGAQVTVIDAGEPGGIATRNSLAWINASWGNRPDYFRLRLRAMEEWRRLERDLPSVRVDWAGGLLWDLPADRLEAFAAEHQSWGYELRCVGRAEAQRIEPQLADPPEVAVHAPGEGAIEPFAVTRALLDAATALGTSVVANNPAQRIEISNGGVTGVATEADRLDADIVVIAAGAGTAALAATAGLALQIDTPPNLLVVTEPHDRVLRGLVMAPALHIRQTVDGRLVAASGVDERDPEVAAHALLGAMRRLLRSRPSLAMSSYALAPRPIPKGGLPIVGYAKRVRGLYIAAMHSGVTLAPAIGRFVVDEILNGVREPLLVPYDPDSLAGR